VKFHDFWKKIDQKKISNPDTSNSNLVVAINGKRLEIVDVDIEKGEVILKVNQGDDGHTSNQTIR